MTAKGQFYAKYTKRIFDVVLAALSLVVVSPIIIILTLTGAVVMRGNPFFVQLRPGRIDPSTGEERLFYLIKFRSMSNKRDKNRELLPDELRLNGYGRLLRKTSLDELPQLLSVISGSCSMVGPRAQLARDIVFMTADQRRRHTVRPGITGLAQVNGRNNITWERKLVYDLEYIDKGVTFKGDINILFKTLLKVFETGDVVRNGTATDTDFGDWLLDKGKITREEYDRRQREAVEFLDRNHPKRSAEKIDYKRQIL